MLGRVQEALSDLSLGSGSQPWCRNGRGGRQAMVRAAGHRYTEGKGQILHPAPSLPVLDPSLRGSHPPICRCSRFGPPAAGLGSGNASLPSWGAAGSGCSHRVRIGSSTKQALIQASEWSGWRGMQRSCSWREKRGSPRFTPVVSNVELWLSAFKISAENTIKGYFLIS